MKRVNRHKELCKAVDDYLTLKKQSFIAIYYRCPDCGLIFNREAKGWPDRYVYHPAPAGIEIKVGKDVLRPDQEEVKRKMEEAGTPYYIIRDTVDNLLEVL